MKRNLATYGALLAAVLAGCTEKDPTASLEDFVEDLNPRTVEVLLPFEEFSDGVQVLGGYGTPATMDRGILAMDFQGLNSRVLIRFGSYPDSVRLFDAATDVATYDKQGQQFYPYEHSLSQAYSTNKAERDLDWTPEYHMRDGLEMTYRWV